MSKKNKGPETPEGYTGYVEISSIGAPPAPQVNLLPPEVKVRQSMGGIRLRALLIVVLVMAVTVVVTISSLLNLADAEAEVAEKEARVQALQAEMAQYSEVPRIKAEVEAARTARDFATSGELPWADYLRAIQAVAPEDWTLTEMSVALPRPMEDPQTSSNPVAAPSVATISFSGRALTLPDVAAWLEGMETIPGLTDPYFSTATITEEDGKVFYETTATVEITLDALADRFGGEDEEGES